MAHQQLILNRYRPIAEAGAGGFGTVQVAWDTRIQRKVAIKCIELDEFDAMRAQWPDAGTHVRLGADGPPSLAQAGNGRAPGDSPALLRQAAADTVPTGAPITAAGARAAGASTGTSAPPAEDAPFSGLDEPEGESLLFDAASEDFVPERSLAHIPGLDEARTAAMLSDANIVAVYDFEVQGTTAYLIMEYVEGITLTQLLRAHYDALTLDIVAAVFSSVAHALVVAHDNQVLHLDIKPDNVLVNRQGQVKVTDFGLATLADASGFGAAGGGTIGYMPLEQMRQESLDARSDEWALASLAYEMLAGENPFLAPDLQRAEAAIEDAELVLPSLCWDGMDAEADDVLFFALDPDREERYGTVEEFAAALEPYLGDPKRGHKELAVLVGHAEEDEEPAPAPVPRIPLVERLSDRAAAVLARVFAVAGTALVSVVAASNLPQVTGWDSPLLWGLVALCVLGALVKPHLGAFMGFVLWGVAMALAGAPLMGVALVAATVAWWWFVGRSGSAPACAALAQPLLGAVGFAGFAPVMAGCFLGVRRAAATAAFSACTALLLSGCAAGQGLIGWIGLDSLAGWDVAGTLPNEFWLSLFPGTDANGFVAALADPSAWCTVASWVAAAAAFSAFCLRGTKTFDVLGAVAACVLLLAGACAAAWITTNVTLWVPGPPPLTTVVLDYLPNAVVPGIAGIIAAAIGIPDRARWEEE